MNQLAILLGAGLIAIGVLTKPKKADTVAIPNANSVPIPNESEPESESNPVDGGGESGIGDTV